MTSFDQKEWLKSEATRLGFCLCGFAAIEPFETEKRVYLDWLNTNAHGEMAYLARPDTLEKRFDPRVILPDGKSAIVLAAQIPSFKRDPRFLVADFARCVDYHETIPPVIDQLIGNFQRRFDCQVSYKTCVDAAPVMERAFAVRAGLGWIGRSSMLIHPEFGSKMILTVVLTDLDFKNETPPVPDHCGKCRRCVDACPTGCIDGETRTIDARRCISYLTIERKSELDQDSARLVGTHIFGCDICTDVCPWNQQRSPDQPKTVLVKNERAFPSDDDFAMDPAAFKQKYDSSPILRRKLLRWLKNLETAERNREIPPRSGIDS